MPSNQLFEQLHSEYYSMVHQMCLGFMKGDEDLAADLSQETFINTWRALDKFQGGSSYKTWIYRITVNTCLKYIRDNKSKLHVSLEEERSGLGELPTENATQQDNQGLYAAIGKLGKMDRLIIMMVLDELKYEEIAEVVGINEGNLRVRIHRIKKQLKKLLNHE
ncbi:RNA polymerase sigma factor [Fulvivirga lutea]|uniref:RNA polymerase sigma factor n=1 Tax=Fulvivirga lutea TaxID=2810512 RepID=A0A974WEV8_9BACT|nr:RNA polymerase sigma factor [Fulvivirga lutea]QSE96630.1 RNA polymerase sigma factor [Fulvivirga lutea]